MTGETRDSRYPPLSGARNWALFLDIDGTLLDIAPTPAAAEVPDDLPGTLLRLGAWLDGAVALISGRALSDIDRLFAPLRLAAAGQHGAELRDSRRHFTEAAGARGSLDRIGDEIDRRLGGLPGVLIENKGMSIAVHFRLAPDQADRIREAMRKVAESHLDTLMLLHGKALVELKPRSVCKGNAVVSLMASPPFAGRVPVFIGDDTTDEDGFAAVSRMGGLAIGVGTNSAAPWHVATPGELRTWLASIPPQP